MAASVLAFANAQSPSSPQPPADQPTFHIGVDAVRIDAVVTDSKGQIVTDLTADDFELKDDGRPQKVTLATFVPVASGPATPATAQADAFSNAPPVVRPLASDEVQRSILILVDDLGISFEGMHDSKNALHTFIDESLLSTDLVALTHTGMNAGMQRQFTTDKRLLHAAVDQLRWTALSRRGVEPFESMEGTGLVGVGGGPGSGGTRDLAGSAKLSDVKEILSGLSTLSATNLTVQAMASLPGRKAIVLVSEGIKMYDAVAIDPRIQMALDSLWDQAARAGVVIYALEARGLQTGGLSASDSTGKLENAAAVRDAAGDRHDALRATQDSLAVIARETGGFAVGDTNGLAQGLHRIVSDIRGFYIIGYTPERERFEKKGATVPSHQISVKVKRPGLKVRSHSSFIGRPAPVAPTATDTPQQALFTTAMSPFAATTMPVKVTPLWSYSSDGGASVRALLHIDSDDLTFVAGDDGRSVAIAETVGVVVDANGAVVNARNATISVRRDPNDTREGGVTYSLLVPVPKPGGYQLRFAVRDTHSDAIGSAGEFIEVPDVHRGAFALSSVLLGAGTSAVTSFDEAASDDDTGPAVRQFNPGDQLLYTYEVYNAAGDVDASPSVWRDGKQLFTAPPASLQSTTDGGPLRAVGTLQLGSQLTSGDYVLQIDAQTGPLKKTSVATTRVDFQVK